jgi:hypothetical protein
MSRSGIIQFVLFFVYLFSAGVGTAQPRIV